jgi:FkbH-like protein
MRTSTLQCALLSSFTLDNLPHLVEKRTQDDGFQCHWFVSPFNQYPQQILADDSPLYAAKPQVIFVAVAVEDLVHDSSTRGVDLEPRPDSNGPPFEDFFKLLRHLVLRLPSSTVFVHSFFPMERQQHSLLELKTPYSLTTMALRANSLLAELTQQCRNLYAVDIAAVLQNLGSQAFDSRLFYLAKMRFGRDATEAIARHYRRLLLAYLGRQKKCIALDLDNTLWGGIVGEDGPDGLLLSDDGPGKAFQDFQRVILGYQQTGTLLAICSRNDAELALSVIQDHPAMILRPHHFSALRINWQDKATNLQEISKELNIGVDSIVFFDDSEHEREQVRQSLPQVTVVDLPRDPSDYPRFAADLPFFDTLAITNEDRDRGQLYVNERERRELRERSLTLDQFLAQLEQQVIVRRLRCSTMLPRIAQLTQRTNQFNLTTRRYTVDELQNLLADGKWRLYAAEAKDRIGDSGIVGAALVEEIADAARLDTFLLSCRVLGRGIETAFLDGIMRDFRASGLNRLDAEFIPTERNGMAKDFLAQHQFQNRGEFCCRPLKTDDLICPKWISLQFVDSEHEPAPI